MARRVHDAVVEMADTGRGDVVKLKGSNPPEWRLRLGDRRIFFRFQSELREIHILRVLRRDRAYQQPPPDPPTPGAGHRT